MNSTPLPEPGPSASDPSASGLSASGPADADADADVRAAFARAALDVTPGPVPLAAVRRAGRARRRRRTAGLAAVSVLGAATAVAAVVALVPVRSSPPEPARVAAPPPAVRTTQAPDPIRTVRSGERVEAGQGFTVWLTEDGKHWKDPDGLENFRGVSDGNIDRSQPGVTHQSEGGPAGAFHSGLYYGTSAAGRVELTGSGGRTVRATLLELPGRPGWGVWYVRTGPGGGAITTVTLYDRAGVRLATLGG
ncbi:hypothetical protein ACFTUC_31705 [Streptomyces sp. NPDC056944]|uniref:hypothetical protein n=1 Tax=Streptomyces sp. NPDC056944 TaxID=3345972 RepID=UPI0036268A69